MRSCVVLLFASLLTLCEAQGTIVTPVFVLKGRDLLLKLQADPPEGVLFVDWKINKTVDLVRFDPSGQSNVHPSFIGRVQLGENKFSVILKNVQEVDSGVYSAEVDTLKGNKTAAEYKVTVQGPVSPVELIVDRVDSSSSESWDLHVTCRTHNSHISRTFRCVDLFRSQEGGEVTTSGASLQVYMLHKVIICNHRNQVHRTQDLINAQQLCPEHADPNRGWVIAVCVLAVILIVIVVGAIFWLYKDPKGLIGLTQGYQPVKEEDAQDETSAPQNPTNVVTYSSDVVKKQDEKSAPMKKRSSRPARPATQRLVVSAPPYSSVPSAAEPTDP